MAIYKSSPAPRTWNANDALSFPKPADGVMRIVGTGHSFMVPGYTTLPVRSVVWSQHFAKTELTGDVSAHLSFWSESTSYIRDTPRGYRVWEGVVDVSGATLNGFTTVEKLNRSADFVRMSDTDPNRIEFSIATRGIENSITLQLTDASPDTKVAVTLKKTIEGGRAPRLVRPNDTFPPAEFTFTLEEAVQDHAVKTFETGPFEDHVALEIIDTEGPIDQSFRYEAAEAPNRGDYYYIRIRQIDGTMAWSSPVWIGGEPPR